MTREVYEPQRTESKEIRELYKLFHLKKAPALIGPDRKTIPLPESIYKILVRVVDYMRQGKGVTVVPVMQELTTQQAANMLGVSRPFLVELLHQDRIPFHKTGTHRRIYLRDLIAYRELRDRNRRKVLDEMARKSVEEGDYDKMYVPDEAE